MSQFYDALESRDPAVREAALLAALPAQIANAKNIQVEEGVYVALQGPTYETLSEYKMIKNIGGDCVGMSTVPEVIVARHMDMETFGISVITDLGVEGIVEAVSHEEVQKVAKIAEKSVGKLVEEFIKN